MEFFDANTDLSGSGSLQGQLSSSYTAALTEFLQTGGADYVAFLAHVVNELSVEDALLVKAEIEAGNFALSGLFSAAQSKTGEVDGDTITNPTPTLTVGDLVIDLTPMLTGAETFTWETAVKKSITYHTREFYTESQEPTVGDVSYSAGWAESNHAPEVSGPVTQTIDEDDAIASVNLLANASDSDNDDLDVSGTISYAVTSGTWDAEIDFDVDPETGELTIDPAQFNSLRETDTLELTFSYNVIDGKGGVTPATAVVTITGTNDLATITVSDNEDTSVKEDAPDNNTAGGKLTVSDADNGEDTFGTIGNLEGTYGDFTFDPDTGAWTYTLDNEAQVVQDLKFYETVYDTLTVASADGTDSQDIVVAIQGAADQYTGQYSFTINPTTLDNTAGTNYTINTSGVDDQAFDFNYSGTATITVTGDIDNNHVQADKDETVAVTIEGQTLVFGPTETDSTNQEPGQVGYVATVVEQSTLYSSIDSIVSVSYDSTTSTGANGVDQINSIEVDVTYTYWV